MMTRKTRTIGAAAVALLAAMPATAQSWPEKPVTMMVTWNAGGTTDIIARLFAEELSGELGQPVPVVNRVGGGGALGTSEALAATDGYTVLMTTSGNHILTPLTNDVGYSFDDFEPIGQLSSRTLALAVLDDKPWTNLDDLKAAAAADPGALTFAAVPNVLPYLTLVDWAEKAGVELTNVPMQGGAPGVTAALGGHVDMVIESLSSVNAHLQEGTMRGLAVFNSERDPAAPDVPTAAEQGYDVYGNPFTGVAIAKGVPEEVVARLEEATARIAADAEFQDRMMKAGANVEYLDAAAFGQVWARDWETFEPILSQ